jgi:Mg-chelatase subunit ChlD
MKLGMEAGLLALQTINAHEMANRVMVVLTDGQYQGDDPFVVAQAAADLGITIHCISLLAGDTYTMAQNIAQETGGDAYMATNAQQLEDAFAEIARSLNVVLTQ